MSLWAVKAKGENMYWAEKQYGPPGARTYSGWPGNDIYQPKRFGDKHEAEKVAQMLDKDDFNKLDCLKWEVVPHPDDKGGEK